MSEERRRGSTADASINNTSVSILTDHLKLIEGTCRVVELVKLKNPDLARVEFVSLSDFKKCFLGADLQAELLIKVLEHLLLVLLVSIRRHLAKFVANDLLHVQETLERFDLLPLACDLRAHLLILVYLVVTGFRFVEPLDSLLDLKLLLRLAANRVVE